MLPGWRISSGCWNRHRWCRIMPPSLAWRLPGLHEVTGLVPWRGGSDDTSAWGCGCGRASGLDRAWRLRRHDVPIRFSGPVASAKPAPINARSNRIELGPFAPQNPLRQRCQAHEHRRRADVPNRRIEQPHAAEGWSPGSASPASTTTPAGPELKAQSRIVPTRSSVGRTCQLAPGGRAPTARHHPAQIYARCRHRSHAGSSPARAPSGTSRFGQHHLRRHPLTKNCWPSQPRWRYAAPSVGVGRKL